MFQYPDPDALCSENCHCMLMACNVEDIPLSLSLTGSGYIRKTYNKLYRKGLSPFSMNGLRTAATTLYLRYIHIINAVKTAITAGVSQRTLRADFRAATANVTPISMAKRYSIGNPNRTGVTIPAGYFQA
jgi:hypothetical protein